MAKYDIQVEVELYTVTKEYVGGFVAVDAHSDHDLMVARVGQIPKQSWCKEFFIFDPPRKRGEIPVLMLK